MSQPVQVIIFGASGDLTRRKLLPAITRLVEERSLRLDDLAVIGVARSPMSDEHFRRQLHDAMGAEYQPGFDALAERVFYRQGDVQDADSMTRLGRDLDDLPGGATSGRLFYLSLKPGLFAETVHALAQAGLTAMRPNETRTWRRVVIEKPFGHDLDSARRLNASLHQDLHEEQIFRIDHYLGKETVQNLIGFRFHNSIFEPLWNRNLVELVQITVAETIGVERGRAAYYDKTGALRDMLQNHMLQLLALVAMEPPPSLNAETVRNEKVELLHALHCPDPQELSNSSVRARYGPGEVDGHAVPGYLDEDGVTAGSQTETYVAVRAEIDNWRWSGVPFLLRHGKRLGRRFTEVKVHFRAPPIQLFNQPDDTEAREFRRMLRDGSLCQIRPNILTLSIQPREQIHLSFGVKQPGNQMRMSPATLDFDYREHFGTAPADAYQRLLMDAINGDATLFLRADEIEASWRYADEVLDGWQQPGAPPLLEYAAGGAGPPEADQLFKGCEGNWTRA